jgi:RNA polymerase sigma-70 factor (ECF subfamily)
MKPSTDEVMPEFPETSECLIARVRDSSNRAAWDQFEQLYRPVVFRIARAKGLQHSDALDLVQQVLMLVSSAIGRHEKHPEGMRFRNWLSRVTRNAILKALSRGPRDLAAGGTDILNILHEVPADDPTDALIELEYRREVFFRAAARVRSEVQDETRLAFEATVLQDVSIEVAAKRFGMSAGSIYAARSRIMRRLRTAVQELESNPMETNSADIMAPESKKQEEHHDSTT